MGAPSYHKRNLRARTVAQQADLLEAFAQNHREGSLFRRAYLAEAARLRATDNPAAPMFGRGSTPGTDGALA